MLPKTPFRLAIIGRYAETCAMNFALNPNFYTFDQICLVGKSFDLHRHTSPKISLKCPIAPNSLVISDTMPEVMPCDTSSLIVVFQWNRPTVEQLKHFDYYLICGSDRRNRNEIINYFNYYYDRCIIHETDTMLVSKQTSDVYRNLTELIEPPSLIRRFWWFFRSIIS